MEGLIKRIWVLAAIVLACGAFTMFSPPSRNKPINEDWMAERTPNAVGQFRFQPDPTGVEKNQSYRMGKSTYDTLQPSGIVAKRYDSGGKIYDVVVIASDSSKSFHDPRVCFTASGWTIVDQQQAQIHTKSRGDVPMTFVKMTGSGTDGKSAMYCYRGPNGFVSVARKMRWDMLVGQLMHARNDQGVFYRFIPMSNNISDQDLQQFAAAYLDEANKASGGFF